MDSPLETARYSDRLDIALKGRGMKVVFGLIAVAMLAGCVPSSELKNPKTGETVTCGAYTLRGLGMSDAPATSREANCIADYKKQGYVEVKLAD